MSEAEQLRQRAKLMLRGERWVGVSGVPMIALANESAIPDAAPEIRADTPPPPSEVRSTRAEAVSSSSAPAGEALFAGAGPDPFGPNRPPFDSPVVSKPKKIELLAALDTNEVKGCPKCVLCKTRTNTVFGEGDADARLMFIGEGPGENEDLQGRPFVGRAGELLNKQIAAMGLSREQVFIANIVKCRPPNNRVPAPDEVAACTPYLERQIEIIRPQVIVTLGLPSTQYMLQTKSAMSKLRGVWHTWRGIRLMPTYHPAYLLRNYTAQARAAVWSDLQQVMSELGLKKGA